MGDDQRKRTREFIIHYLKVVGTVVGLVAIAPSVFLSAWYLIQLPISLLVEKNIIAFQFPGFTNLFIFSYVITVGIGIVFGTMYMCIHGDIDYDTSPIGFIRESAIWIFEIISSKYNTRKEKKKSQKEYYQNQLEEILNKNKAKRNQL